MSTPLPSTSDLPGQALGPQFLRYLCVGVFNTLFGYCTFALTLSLFNRALPQRFLYLTVVLASVSSTPLNITVAYFGYKFFVFRTHGNTMREWLKAFAVYGTSMLIGLVALSVLTRMLQAHSAWAASFLLTLSRHLHGSLHTAIQHLATSNALAGYLAGAIVTALSTVYSFFGHRKFTFSPSSR